MVTLLRYLWHFLVVRPLVLGLLRLRVRHRQLLPRPEGTRGEPEKLGPFKTGVAHLMRQHPEVPLYPIHLQGFGRVLPKGSWMLRPHGCRAVVGLPLHWDGDQNRFMRALRSRLSNSHRSASYFN